MAYAFKVGDRVESLDRYYGGDLLGWPWGTVVKITRDGTTPYLVEFDEGVLQHRASELRPDTRWGEHRVTDAIQRAATLPVVAARPTTLPTDSAERKRIPLYSGPVRYFPAALAGVAQLCEAGNRKHNPGQPLHWAREKSTDHEDCILRHTLDMSDSDGDGVDIIEGTDPDGTPFRYEIPHVVSRAWRALAAAQLYYERHGAPMAPGAREPGAEVPA